MSFLDTTKLEAKPSEVKPENAIDFKEIHEKSRINLKEKPKRSPLVLSCGYDDVPYKGEFYPLRFGTAGNISMIKGEEKTRKSWLKSLILGCAIGGNANLNCDLIKSHNLQDKYIIDIDTEQDYHDAWMVADRVKRLVGAEPPNYEALNLREYSPMERCQYTEWLFMESPYRNNLGIVSIDGYVDLLKDFNSLTESIEFTQKLMKWSSITKSHITGVLHLNPGSEKARGHLGTILQQKCETVVIIQDKGEYSLVTCKQGRGKKFKPFGISVDGEWLPYQYDVSDFSIEDLSKGKQVKPNF